MIEFGRYSGAARTQLPLDIATFFRSTFKGQTVARCLNDCGLSRDMLRNRLDSVGIAGNGTSLVS